MEYVAAGDIEADGVRMLSTGGMLAWAREARPGDTVLLSPACSSFDQFKDYAERGNVYKELVRAL